MNPVSEKISVWEDETMGIMKQNLSERRVYYGREQDSQDCQTMD